MKILIIDDQQDNLISLKAVINSRIPKCNVIMANSGKTGIQLAQKEQPDTILLDIFMPLMDGFEACGLLKNDELTKHIPIIMITAFKSDAESRAKAMESGADAFVSKPIDPLELSAQIKVMLRIKAAEDELRKEKDDLELKVKERSKELKKQKETLNQIIYGNTIPTLVIDSNHIVTHWNKACENLTGVSGEDIVGTQNHGKVFYKESRPLMADIVLEKNPEIKIKKYYKDNYQKSTLTKNAYQSEAFFPDLNNKERWLYFTAVPLFSGSTIIGAIETLQDITVNKNYELQLKESEEKYRNLVERANDGICIIQNEIVVYTNTYLLDLWGGSKEEVIGKPFNNFVHPDSIEQLLRNYRNRLSGIETPSIYETTLIHKSGRKVYAELSAGIIKYKGTPANLVIIRDISYRKKTDIEINRLSTAVEQSPTTTIITDINGLIEYANLKAVELTGYSQEEIIGKKSNILNSGFHSDEFYKELWETIERDKIWKGEFQNRKKDGELFWESASISPIHDDSGRITNYVKVAEDITEKKRAEQIQLVLYNISNAVLRTDSLELLIETIQNELASVIDTSNFYVALYDEKDDSLFFPFYSDKKDSFSRVSAKKTLTKYVIETKKPLLANLAVKKRFVEEGILEHVGSLSKVWLGVPLIIDGIVIGAFAVQSYDNETAYNKNDMQMLEFVSEQISISIHRKKAVDELMIALKKATESDRLKTAFLQNISHEIRTPMNGIFGFASLLKDPNLSGEEQQSYIDVIMISGKRMLGTLNDLMDISMLETDQVKVSHEHVNINKELQNLYDFFIGETVQKNLELVVNKPLADNKITIITDKSKLYAILSNLIKNSIKYSNDGRIEFGYELTNNFIQFYVLDNGIGIPKTKHEVIFNRFEQADIEDVKVHEGSGLGLSISRGYIELLGGKIWLESEVGVGSKFQFTIPYNPLIHDPTTETVSEISKPKTESQKTIKILIAEDEVYAEEYLNIVLNDICPNPLHAKDGAEAVKISKENPDIDLILMDIKMPIMNGFQAIKKIREFNKDVIIIAQTAYALAGDREKVLAVGSDDYISKPIKREELLEKINIHLGKK